MHLDLRVEVSRNFYWDLFTYFPLPGSTTDIYINIYLWTIFQHFEQYLPGLIYWMDFFYWFWKFIPSHIFLFLDQPQPNRKQEGYKYSTCLNSRWVVLLRSTRNLWKPLYSSIGFECHQFNLNATTPPNKGRFTLLDAWISSWNFESLNINNLSWWDGGHLLVEYQPKNIVLHLVNWQDQDDYWLRAVTTWNFLQWYLCWYYIFLASAEYIDLEINFKSDRVYILTI